MSAPAPSLSPFGDEGRRRSWLVPAGIGLSMALHGGLATWIALQPQQLARAAQWVEMSVAQPPPPPPPPPPPEPEPPKPKAKAEPVKFKEINPVEAPPVETPPPAARRVVKMQGLAANSFAQGSGTGLDVRAGTTVGTRATSDTMSIDEARGARSYASVTTPPRVRVRAQMEVPREAQDNDVEGEVKVLLDLGADGSVTLVRVLSDLGFGTGEACAAAWKRSRFVPAQQHGQPVAVTGMPQVCTIVRQP
ncbi:MAG: energy transducer TonB [Deltaproteobacteria bacterium]|nr:energy transducer TonB [Deltaproteobacteria bacterium]